jgi:hypothetical protein
MLGLQKIGRVLELTLTKREDDQSRCTKLKEPIFHARPAIGLHYLPR